MKHKLVVEIDQKGYTDRDERKEKIEKELGCKFIRSNPDKKKKLVSMLNLIDKISKRLLELEFKSNHSIKSKCLKWIVQKILPSD